MSEFKLIHPITNSIYKFIINHTYLTSAGIALISVCSLLYHSRRYLQKAGSVKKKPKQKQSANSDAITEVLFFSDENAFCKEHINEAESSCNDCGSLKLSQLVEYLDMATETLDVCVYTITSIKLAEAVLRKFDEGVSVRIITDESMAYGDGSQIPLFRRNGVRVRAKPSQNLMHHKFAVIDRKVLVSGSFNWTQQATFGNWENVIITSQPEKVVQKFCDEFDKLWKILD